MSAAPSWPLIFAALIGRTFRSATAIAPGLNFDSLRWQEAQAQELSPESVPQTFKTQNDARGAGTHPPVQTFRFTDCKSPKFDCLPTAPAGSPAAPAADRVFRCRPDMGWRSWKFEG